MNAVLIRCGVVALLLLFAASCGGPPGAPPSEVIVARTADLPQGPADAAWRHAPVYRAELLLQDMVEPRLIEASTSLVSVRAMTDGSEIAFQLDWKDDTRDDLPSPGRFSDACAVQLPVGISADVPAPQMGEPGRAVEISFWRATWQASLDGRPDDIRAIHPGATVDHYPFEAAGLEPGSKDRAAMRARYSPARALGNVMEGPRERAVEDLLAEGPGSLTRAESQRSDGSGRRSDDGWQVMIRRPLSEALTANGRGQIAFAVWQGAAGEVGARKMRTGWVPIAIEEGS
ncbi:MAG: hypothetical protein JSV80_12160 [Acidobacteriota bacterium]|nr:MAG: hypothetical protein JSV80_12160 [Acidobacteriota bacterium]